MNMPIVDALEVRDRACAPRGADAGVDAAGAMKRHGFMIARRARRSELEPAGRRPHSSIVNCTNAPVSGRAQPQDDLAV
jgi:hypothetical protein